MTDVPRKLPTVREQRQAQLLERAGGGLVGGRVRSAAVVPAKPATPQGIPTLLTVTHLSDPNFSRPVAVQVYWRGEAIPNAKEPTDLWYPSNDV